MSAPCSDSVCHKAVNCQDTKIFVVVEIPVLEEVVSLAKRNLVDFTETDYTRASFLEAATAQSLKIVNGMKTENQKKNMKAGGNWNM